MKTIQLPVSDDLHAQLKDAAWKAKQGLGDHVRSVLEAHVEKVASTNNEEQEVAK